MSHMMVIVSKAVFDKARDADGDKLEPGSIYETAAYLSNNKSIEKNLSGNLYLVTVRDEELWLVGCLVDPEHNGVGWFAELNEEEIVDITDIAGEFEFENGKGINLEKMAMSLQTPRVLTEGDVALLEEAWGYTPDEPIDVTPEQIDAAVVKVLAAVLERTEDEVRGDTGRYAAFQWDDGFVDYHFSSIDWGIPSLEVEFETEDWIFGRTDIDVARSVFDDEHFHADATSDRSLRGLFESQHGALYGAQLAELVREERFALNSLDLPAVFGRIRASGESLLEAAKGLFMLNDFPEVRLIPGEYAEVDENWVELIESIEPPALAAHLGMFFQDANAARCVGAALTGSDDGSFLTVGDKPHQEIIVSWWIGEGQGDCYIARIVDDTIPAVPEFAGRDLLTRPAMPDLPERSRWVESSDEILRIPLREHLEGVEEENYVELLDAAGERDLRAFIAGMSIAQPSVWSLLTPINAFSREENAHGGLAMLHAVREVMTPEERRRTALRWAQHLSIVGCHAEAVDAYTECEEIGPECSQYFMQNFSQVYAESARAAIAAGHWDLALAKAEAALVESEDHALALTAKAVALYELDKKAAAFELVARLMSFGIDPLPTRPLAEDPEYRELALNHSIAVPVWT